MGIRGLTTYLSDRERVLSKSLACSANSEPTNLVVDGWSFIFHLFFLSNNPWVYGGEMKEFAACISRVIQGWIAMNLNLYFVFDGPAPPLKFPTLKSRLVGSNIKHSILFFTTSSVARSSSRFLNHNKRLPALTYETCLHTLQTISQDSDALQVHFADGEGDMFCVELAGRVRGYVLANDSDFVVMNVDGYLGYIPLASMRWLGPTPSEDQDEIDAGEDGFQTVHTREAKKRSGNASLRGLGIIPPEVAPSMLVLRCSTYSPGELSSHLGIPITLLPLLGALAGNDFLANKGASQSLVFENASSGNDRISRIASTLRSILSTASQQRKVPPISDVVDLIARTVKALQISPAPFVVNKLDAVTEDIANATMPYIISESQDVLLEEQCLWPTKSCALHRPEDCPMSSLFTRRHTFDEGRASEPDSRSELGALYLRAYRMGQLNPKMMFHLSSATSWPRVLFEHPDVESVSRSIGRALRMWVYAFLEDAIGLPEPLRDENEHDAVTQAAQEGKHLTMNPDEVQHETVSTLLQDASEEPSVSPPAPPDTPSQTPIPRPKVITEYVRKGSQIALETLPVQPLSTLLRTISISFTDYHSLPIPLRPESERLTILLRILQSDVPEVRNCGGEQLGALLAVRWVVHVLNTRAKDAGYTKAREMERWTLDEASAFLASFEFGGESQGQVTDPPPILERHIQLTAQVTMALESIEQLIQVLFLSCVVPSVAHLFSGRAFHALLSSNSRQSAASDSLRNAVVAGLEEAFRVKVRKKDSAKVKSPTPSRTDKLAKTKPQQGNQFCLLADMDSET